MVYTETQRAVRSPLIGGSIGARTRGPTRKRPGKTSTAQRTDSISGEVLTAARGVAVVNSI